MITKLKVGHTPQLTGLCGKARCTDLTGIEDGDVVRVVTPRKKVYVRVYDEQPLGGVITLSEDAWRRVRVKFDEPPEAIEIRPLTRWERWTRRVTLKHAAAVLVLIAAVYTAGLGAASVIAPADDTDLVTTRTGLAIAAGWDTGLQLTGKEVEVLEKAHEAVQRVKPPPDQLDPG